jgi:hypothetical protein
MLWRIKKQALTMKNDEMQECTHRGCAMRERAILKGTPRPGIPERGLQRFRAVSGRPEGGLFHCG